MSSGATSCTERAKKSRVSSTAPRLVADECRERGCPRGRSRDTEQPSRRNRDPNAGEGCDDTGLEVAEGRGAGNLRELDPTHATEQPVGGQREEHRVAENRADLIGETRQPNEHEREPEAV